MRAPNETLGRQLGPFAVEGLIGRGGMADVFRGVHMQQNTPVAIKVITASFAREPMFQQCFRNEVQSVARLHHPGIVMVYDHGRVTEAIDVGHQAKLEADSPYLVMEHARHGALDSVKRRLRWTSLRALLLSLLDALAHAHARGVLHRDLKPGNILVCGTDEPRPGVKLTDFGIAHALEREGVPNASEITGGTPLFMAPEQFDASWRDYGPWTDLYALGCLTFLWATGRPPFVADHAMALAVSHLRKTPPRLEAEHPMPRGLEAWALRLLEKDPNDRFRFAADAAWALRALPAPRDASGPEDEPTVLRALAAPESPDLTERPAFDDASAGISDRTYTLVWDSSLEGDTEELHDTVTDLRLDAEVATETAEEQEDDELLMFLDDTDDEDETRAAAVAYRPEPLVALLPPLPRTWRRPEPSGPPVHLMGAGLGLYGLRSIPMVDRLRERDLLWHALRLVREDGSARAIVLTGVAGTGKSRLVEWIAQRAAEVGSAIVLRANLGPHGSPTDGLPKMLARYLRCTDLGRDEVLERTEDVLRRLGATDPHEWHAVTELLAPAPLDDARSAHFIHLPEGRERHAVLLGVIERLTAERPVIVWLDDVHWSTDALQFARYVLDRQTRQHSPILLMMTARDELLAERSLEAKILDGMKHSPRVGELKVKPLSAQDHEDLVQELLGFNRHVARMVAKRTSGNPQFAIQLVGDWVQRGVLTLGDSGFSLGAGESTVLPDGVHEVWDKRLELLLEEHPGDARVALEIAAVLGRDVDQIEWEAACKKAQVEAPARLVDDLSQRRLVQPTELGFSFCHAMMRETVERQARERGDFEVHHRRCAQMLYERYGTLTRGMAERIGRHYLAGGSYQEALSPLLRGASERLFASEYLEALALLKDYEKALVAVGAPKADARWGDCWVLRARVATLQGNLEESVMWAERAEENARRWDRSRVVAEATRERAVVAYHRGRPDEALERFHQARATFEALEDPIGVAQCHIGTGDVRYRLGNLAGAADRYLDALATVGSTTNTIESAAALWGLGYVALWQGQSERARRLFGRQRKIAERSANRHGIGRCLNGLAEVARIEGELDLADELYLESIAIFEAIGSPEARIGQLNRALVLMARGDLVEARNILETVRPTMDGAVGRIELVQMYAMLLPTEADAGAWSAVDEHLTILERLLEECRFVDGDIAWSLDLAARRLRQSGEVARAVAAYRVAAPMWRALQRTNELRDTERALAELGHGRR